MNHVARFVCLSVFLCLVGSMAFSQNYEVRFTSTPPTIDGAVSPGEWDGAASAITEFVGHDTGNPEDAQESTRVRALYSVDGLYILYECTDTDVVSIVTGSERYNGAPQGTPGQQTSGSVGWTFGGTDYLAIYIDPANVADDRTDVDPSFYSYSLQAEPSITANQLMDDNGNSYNYTEFGRFGGARIRNTMFPEIEGTLVMWLGGGSWEISDKTEIKDGASADGYVMEFKIAWSDLNLPYYETYGGRFISDQGVRFIDLEGIDNDLNSEETTVWGLERIPGGNVTGMPLPGTVWKVQFARHSASAAVQYVNWVGSTGGFVSRPFGSLTFGAASPSAVLDALIHN